MNGTYSAIVRKRKNFKYDIVLMFLIHMAFPWLVYSVPPLLSQGTL